MQKRPRKAKSVPAIAAASSGQKPKRRDASSRSSSAGKLARRSTGRRSSALLAVSGFVRRQRQTPTGRGAPKPVLAKERKHRRQVTIKIHSLAKLSLDQIAREHGKTLQELGVEAIALLLETYGRKPIA